MTDTCKTCRFWWVEKAWEDINKPSMAPCRRRAPSWSERNNQAVFPAIEGTGWCGEHTPKDKADD